MPLCCGVGSTRCRNALPTVPDADAPGPVDSARTDPNRQPQGISPSDAAGLTQGEEKMADAPSQQDEQQTEIILTIPQMKEQQTRHPLRIQQLEEAFDKISIPLFILISLVIPNLCFMIVLII